MKPLVLAALILGVTAMPPTVKAQPKAKADAPAERVKQLEAENAALRAEVERLKGSAPKVAAAPAPLKAAPPDGLKAPYTEIVKYEPWQALDKRFGRAKEGVWAWRPMVGTEQRLYLRISDVPGGAPPAGSRLADADGAAWIVTKASKLGPDYLCYVRPETPMLQVKPK